MASNTAQFYDQITKDKINVVLNYPDPSDKIVFGHYETGQHHVVDMHNARQFSVPASIEKQGFCLLSSNIDVSVSSIDDLTPDMVKSFETILIDTLSAEQGLLLGAVVRHEHKKDTGLPSHSEIRAPGSFIHADWGLQRLKTLTTAPDPIFVNNSSIDHHDIAKFMKGFSRWGLFNVWIPLTQLTNNNLGLCSINHLDNKDIVRNFKFNETAEGMTLKYNPAHQWCYYPLMQSNECLIFKQYDSLEPDNAYTAVFHGSFNILTDDNLIMNPRKSLELRYLVGY
ncbi:CmcJ/NvfI family oxidoreductase [uncultured Shewanella sp.]|uniref:CmcJ/NvfI family oxidoreductase n=1 Tax=uncultured Shewanella sp. TaxID=173975 RepID=UPI002620A51B|nr:CmcJ/NvfI family oxidoreductase [uncultured Shewanella sp.]